MTAEFTALEPGWANIYHNKETDKVYLEPCPGVVTYTKTEIHRELIVGTTTFMGYASFGANGSWEIAAKRPHYVRTYFLGVGVDFSRELYDELMVPFFEGNMLEVQ